MAPPRGSRPLAPRRRPPLAAAALACGAVGASAAKFDCSRPWWQPVSAFFGQDWSAEQKEWCCKQQQVGCAGSRLAPDAISFDCDEEAVSWKDVWSQQQKDWCCEHKNRGCQAPEYSLDPYNCQDDLDSWKKSWTDAKKNWCCMFDNLGCEEASDDTFPSPSPAQHRPAGAPTPSIHTLPAATAAVAQHHPSTTAALEPYACEDSPSEGVAWSFVKRQWCCQHHQKGCSDADALPEDYDCSEPSSDWLPRRRKWCCAEEGIGCEDEVATTASTSRSRSASSHDCSGGEAATDQWTKEKREWCCREELIGCTPCDHICDVRGFQATCRSRVEWSRTRKFKGLANACEAALGTVLRDCDVCAACTFDDACPKDARAEAALVAAADGADAPFSCTPAVPGEEALWSPERRRWCCEDSGRACATKDAAPEEAFDCTEDVETLRTTWSNRKRDYCCKHSAVGCPDCETICTYSGVGASCRDRVDWLVKNGALQGDDICAQAHREVVEQCEVCARCSVGDTCAKAAPKVRAFDCDEDAAHWRSEWSQAKQRWCCRNEGKGCMDLVPTTTTATRASTTADAAPLFDCKERVAEWQTSWTQEKRAWCCASENLGCAHSKYDCQDGAPVEWATVKQDWCCKQAALGCDADADMEPYTCDAKGARDSSWTLGQKAWCCKHHDVGCDLLAPGGSDIVAPAKRWDCMSEVLHWEEDWSDAKKDWCCGKYKIGCPPTPPAPLSQPAAVQPRSYNCQFQLEDWAKMWSPLKAAWCCEHRLVGCPTRGNATRSNATQSNATLEAFDCGGSGADWTQGKRTFCCRTQQRGCSTTDAESCEGSSSDWSASKTARCCKEQGIACGETATLTTSQAPASTTTTRAPPPTTTTVATTTTWYACGEVGEVAPAGWDGEQKDWCCRHEGRGCVAPCYDHDVAYLPFDMPGQFVSYETGPEKCQERCRRTTACKHFTYIVREGSCHISDDVASQVTWFDAFSGPASCRSPASSSTGGDQDLTIAADADDEAERFRARQLLFGVQRKVDAELAGPGRPQVTLAANGTLVVAAAAAFAAAVSLVAAVATAVRGQRAGYGHLPSWRSEEQEYSAVADMPLHLMQ